MIDQRTKIKVRAVDVESLDMPAIKSLYRTCNWDWLEPDTEMFIAFRNSWRLFVATSENKVVGFARIVSDGKIYGLLTDFIVDPGHRRKGYGQELARMVVEQSEIAGLRVIQLLASREGLSIYQRAGFTKCPEQSPGMINFLKSKIPAPKAQVSAQREQPAKQANTTERKQNGESARRSDPWSVEVVAEDWIAPSTQVLS